MCNGKEVSDPATSNNLPSATLGCGNLQKPPTMTLLSLVEYPNVPSRLVPLIGEVVQQLFSPIEIQTLSEQVSEIR